MALKSSEVRVAGTGELFLAPVGTTLPADTTTALPVAWKGFGYTTEDGVVLTKSVEREGVPAWQSVTPVRYITTGLEFTVQTTLLQSNEDTIALWLGSDAFATVGATTDYSADVPVDPVTQQFALVVEWKDGTVVSRLAIAKAEVTETGDVSLARAATGFPVTFGAIAPDTGSVLATWLTNDPNFATGAMDDANAAPQDADAYTDETLPDPQPTTDGPPLVVTQQDSDAQQPSTTGTTGDAEQLATTGATKE